MAKQFHIAYKNSSRWVQQGVTFDARYNTLPFDYQTDEYNYYQPRQTNDIEPIQFLSDWPCTLKYYKCDGTLVQTITVTEVPISIVGYTFKCYQATVDWSLFTPNQLYIGIIEYTDDDANVIQWACTPIDLRIKWANSLLFQYKNDINDEDGIIWTTGIEFNVRIEAFLGKFQPGSSRSQFIDQDYDGELLFGQSYRKQTLELLDIAKIGLPNWIIDKMNRIFTECNSIRVDNDYYIAQDGQEFKLTRASGGRNEDAFAELDVLLVPNPNFGSLETGDIQDDNEYIIMPKPLQFVNKGAPFSFAGVFDANTSLEHIVLTNTGGGADFEMKLGTTLGGSEIAVFKVRATPQQFKLIDHYFNGPSTLYITIPNGVNITGWVKWMKYDLPNINVNPVTPSRYVKGNVYYYLPANITDYPNEFDNTGIGVPGSDHEGCVVCGTNGYYMGIDWNDATLLHKLSAIGTLSNNGTFTLSRSQLPAAGVEMFTGDLNSTLNDAPGPNQHAAYVGLGGGSLEYQIRRGNDSSAVTVGKTANMGDGAEISNLPKGVYGVFFTYIG